MYHFEGVLDAFGSKAHLVQSELLVHVVFELDVILLPLPQHVHATLLIHLLR